MFGGKRKVFKKLKLMLETICLKYKLRKLKNRRSDRVDDIVATKQRVLARVGELEDIDPDFFEHIDFNISKVERLINIKKIRKNKIKENK